jgi:hypothetical protein
VLRNRRKLESVCLQLREIQAEDGLLKYVTAGDEAALLSGIIEEVRDAIIEYQVSFSWFKLALEIYAVQGCLAVRYL